MTDTTGALEELKKRLDGAKRVKERNRERGYYHVADYAAGQERAYRKAIELLGGDVS